MCEAHLLDGFSEFFGMIPGSVMAAAVKFVIIANQRTAGMIEHTTLISSSKRSQLATGQSHRPAAITHVLNTKEIEGTVARRAASVTYSRFSAGPITQTPPKQNEFLDLAPGSGSMTGSHEYAQHSLSS